MTDIKLLIDDQNNPFELAFSNGDFAIDTSDEQNVRLNLLSTKGNWKQYPLIGCNVNQYLHQSSARSRARLNIINDLLIDNIEVQDVSMEFNNETGEMDYNITI